MSFTKKFVTAQGPLDYLDHFPQGSDEFISHPSQAKIGIHPYPDQLYVLTMISNPLRFRKRYENFWRFEKEMTAAGAILYVAEVALENRAFEITDANNPRHLQLRTVYDAPWYKENALDLLVQRLPPECQKLGVFDADIKFARDDWAQEVLHALAHYDVIQPFSHAQDLGPKNEPIQFHESKSFMYQYVNHGIPPHAAEFMGKRLLQWRANATVKTKVDDDADGNLPGPHASPYIAGKPGEGWHPGLAWCFRKSAWDKIGGLPDWLPSGSGDWHMANALAGNLMNCVNPNHTPGYLRNCRVLEARCSQIRNNPSGGLGYIDGLILHNYHGSKANRNYNYRHKFIINVGFDPDYDLIRDHQGLWQLSGRNPKLRDGLRDYSRMRNEDEN